MSSGPPIDPGMLLEAYSCGIFPMGNSSDDELRWYSPDPRGIIPLDGLIVSRSLRRTIAKNIFEIRINSDFDATIRGCAARSDVWITESIIRLYTELHRLGHAHSVEAWSGGELCGGLYGVTIGAVFFGESMFSRRTDASKTALVALVDRLNERGFELLDTQYQNDHLRTLGCIEIPKEEYLTRLHRAVQRTCTFI